MDMNMFEQSRNRLFTSIHNTFELSSKEIGHAVYLAGGGEDSAAALLHFIESALNSGIFSDSKKDIHIHTIYMDYGQLVAKVEFECIVQQCNILRKLHQKFIFEEPIVLQDPLKELILGQQGLLTGGQGSAYIEYRNIRYLTTAAAYASMVDATWIIAGLAPAVMSVDSGYAASVATQFALDQNTLNETAKVRIYAPIVLAHRSACVRYLHGRCIELDIDVLPTFSCYTPKKHYEMGKGKKAEVYEPCGTCLSCQVRIGGHRLGGYPDKHTTITVKERP